MDGFGRNTGKRSAQSMISPYGMVEMETKGREMMSGSVLVHKNKIKLHLDVANVPPFEGSSSYLYVFRSVIKR